MTTLQMKLAIAIKDFGSISSAAKELNISQPNASNYIRTLEEELGFSIFHRSNTGMKITPKGEQFLIYARQIVDMNDKVMKLSYEDDTYRLRLGTVNYYAACEPFFELCRRHRDNSRNDFSLLNVSISEAVQKLRNHTLDVVAIPIMKHQSVGLHRECENAGIETHSICEIPSIIMVRRNHPAALDGRCIDISQGSDVMKDYPYVGIRSLSEGPGSTSYSDSDFVQCSYKIFVDDTHMRLRTIESTNGFGFGIMTSRRIMSQFELDYFPVPNISLELFCLTLPGAEKKPAVNDYMTLLSKDMHRILF